MVEDIKLPEIALVFGTGHGPCQALADDLEQCVFLVDAGGRYLSVNRGFGQWLGRPDSEIVGRTVFDLWPRSLAERYAADNRRVLGGDRVEVEENRPRNRQLRTVRTVKIPPVVTAEK